MATHQSAMAVVIKGALAGAAGTAAMTAFLDRGGPQMLEQLGIGGRRPPTPPAKPGARTSPSRRVAERAAGSTLVGHEGEAGELVHWAYGSAWGAYYAVVQSTLRLPPLVHGTLLAGLMTFVALRVLPPLGLAPAPRTNDQLAVHASAHAVFAWTTALAYAVLNLGRRR